MAHAKKKIKIVLEKSTIRDVVVSEAIIRPTGLVDPIITLKPVDNQVEDILEQIRQRIILGQRVLITTLTKKFAEELDLYLKQINIKSAYIHSDVDTLERINILADLRRGRYDVLIGINLLREGLELPEVGLVAIFDADKEGFLRSKTSLIQTIGRAARHSQGEVLMYGDNITKSMQGAIDETNRRREIQVAHNLKNGITPTSTIRSLKTITDELKEEVAKDKNYGKAGARLGTSGFEEVEGIENWEIRSNPFDSVELNSRFKNGKGSRQLNRYGEQNNLSGKSRSVHGDRQNTGYSTKGKQVYDSFDEQKEQNIQLILSQKLKPEELTQRLQTAIDELDFEMAAAIRDILSDEE
jgi:excinuclease ABC subunit B